MQVHLCRAVYLANHYSDIYLSIDCLWLYCKVTIFYYLYSKRMRNNDYLQMEIFISDNSFYLHTCDSFV